MGLNCNTWQSLWTGVALFLDQTNHIKIRLRIILKTIILPTASQSACSVHLDGLCAIYHKLKLQSLCYFVLDLYIKPFHSYRKGEWGNIKAPLECFPMVKTSVLLTGRKDPEWGDYVYRCIMVSYDNTDCWDGPL